MHIARMISWLLSAGIIANSGCSISMNNGYRFDFQGEQSFRKMEFDIPDEVQTLDLKNAHGDVNIEASTDGRTSVHWDLTCWADTIEEAERQTKLVQLESQLEGETYRLNLRMPKDDLELLRGVKSNLLIRVPSHIAVNLKNSHGNIVARKIDTPLNLQGAHGDLMVENLTKACTLQNSHGDVNVTNVVSATVKVAHGDTVVSTVHEGLTISGSHGSVTASNVTGDVVASTSFDRIELHRINGAVTARNSHGDIRGQGWTSDLVEVESSFGDIEIATSASSIECSNSHGGVEVTATNPELRDVKIKTSFDNVTLNLPASCRPRIKTKATFGDIRCDFEQDVSSGPLVDLKAEHGDINVISMATAERE